MFSIIFMSLVEISSFFPSTLKAISIESPSLLVSVMVASLFMTPRRPIFLQVRCCRRLLFHQN